MITARVGEKEYIVDPINEVVIPKFSEKKEEFNFTINEIQSAKSILQLLKDPATNIQKVARHCSVICDWKYQFIHTLFIIAYNT